MSTAPSRSHERDAADGEEVVNVQSKRKLAPAAAKTSSGSTSNTERESAREYLRRGARKKEFTAAQHALTDLTRS